ncbi:MAG: PQQ-dependent sugar dehydrogenase [Anaerolineales bacterium]|nr:PQQ-dependent sugar dehydrogenase [Anaerolineales bacterium]
MRRALLPLVLTTLACSLGGLGTPTATPTAAPSEPTSPPPAASATPSDEVVTPAGPDESPTPAPVTSLPDPETAVWTQVAAGLTQPLGLEHAGDDRLFVLEQPGVVRIVRDGQVMDTPFLDIRDRVVDSANEQGLLGLAFHPNYPQPGTIFINYTGQGGNTFISRFEVSDDPERVDPNSERVLLRITQPFANHNGGGMVFGPDGYLYISTGDGGAAGDPQGNAQSLDTLLGKLLRIDVDAGEFYAIPPDNPFVDRNDARHEIWDYGLRNPWRFTFDPATGDLYIADVGQNAWEEINFEPADSPGGRNYGWDYREGAHPFEGDPGGLDLVDPVAEYSREFGCSVTGGPVVRSPSLPRWNGVYLYGDFCSGIIWGLLRSPDGSWLNQQLYSTDFNLTSFGVDAAGEVYALDRGGGVYRLTPSQ